MSQDKASNIMPDLMATELYLFNNIHIKNEAYATRESTKTSFGNLRKVDEAIVPE